MKRLHGHAATGSLLLFLSSGLLCLPTAAEADAPLLVPPGAVAVWATPEPAQSSCHAEAPGVVTRFGQECVLLVDLLSAPGSRFRIQTPTGPRTVEVAAYPYAVQRIRLDDDAMVHPDAESLARIAAENRRISALWGLRSPSRFSLPLAEPLSPLPAGGRFGARRIINDNPRNPHSGADYAAARGTPVQVVADGTVVLAEEHYFAGNSVFVDHGDGLISMYFHLDEIHSETGQELQRGQVLGTVGASGRATGPHLHFGLRWRGARIDPGLLLPGGEPHRLDPADKR